METKRILVAGLLMVSLYVGWSMFLAPVPPSLESEQAEEISIPTDGNGNSGGNDDGNDNSGGNDDGDGDGDDWGPNNQESLPSFDFVHFTVVNPSLYVASLSSKNGGTFEQYELPDYLGAYSDQEGKKTSRGKVGYDEDKPFGFLYSEKDGFPDKLLGCNPCLKFTNENGEEKLLEIKSVTVTYRDEEVEEGQIITLSFEEKTETVRFELELVDSEIPVIHEMIFASEEYAVKHVYSNLPDRQYSAVWKNGIAPAERFAWEDNNNFCAGYVDINQEEAWNEYNVEHEPLGSGGQKVLWAGVRNKFFVTSIVPYSDNDGALLTPLNLDAIPPSVRSQYLNAYNRTEVPAIHDIKVVFDRSEAIAFDTFLAPLDYSIISAYEDSFSQKEGRDLGMDKIMTQGFWPLSEISKFVSLSIQFLYGFLGFAGYGLVLIVFALFVRLISGPITKRSLKATQKMQVVQPLIKDIQEKYKSDPKKMQTKIMQTYKENNVNPLSGCLLMFLQWPIMIPPFIIFRSAVELRSESFLWIKDLSQPDYLIYLPFEIPWLGTGEGWTGVGVLPLLMGFTLYLTMKKTMANAPGQNKAMLYIMNTMFVLLFNSFPAGLNLYYVCYNILNYLQQRSTSADAPDSPSLLSKVKGFLQKQKK